MYSIKRCLFNALTKYPPEMLSDGYFKNN